MAEFWETNFQDKQMMWGEEPSPSAIFAKDYFLKYQITEVLIPGIGYVRNAKPFLDAGMSVTGIEISKTAIDLAKREMGLDINIYHGSVTDMPFDNSQYDGVFCYSVIHLLNASQREKLIKDCYNQLKTGGYMIFTAISKQSNTYKTGVEISKDRFIQHGGAEIFFYDKNSVQSEFSDYGLVEFQETDNSANSKNKMTYFDIVCKKE